MSNIKKYETLPFQIEKLIDKTNVFNQISTRAADPTNSTLVEFKTFNESSLRKIAEGMPEINRAMNSFGRKNTQTTNKLMTLTMLNDVSPYRVLRQCLAQIENRREAIKENVFKLKKIKIDLEHSLQKIQFLKKSYDMKFNNHLCDRKFLPEQELEKFELQRDISFTELEIEKMSSGLADSTLYIEGALKEIASFQEVYEEIRKNNDIPKNWDESNFEEAEVDHHVKMGLLHSFRDCVSAGRLNIGTLEYLQQFGMHPQKIEAEILRYITDNKRILQNSMRDEINNDISYDHLEDFLDSLVSKYREEYKKVLKRLGIETLIGNWYLYKEMESIDEV